MALVALLGGVAIALAAAAALVVSLTGDETVEPGPQSSSPVAAAAATTIEPVASATIAADPNPAPNEAEPIPQQPAADDTKEVQAAKPQPAPASPKKAAKPAKPATRTEKPAPAPRAAPKPAPAPQPAGKGEEDFGY